MKHINNESEIQLETFLVHWMDSYTTLLLRPQGDNTIIEKGPINLCEVTVNGNTYLFGGIKEKFYDRMVSLYDWREDNVRESKINNLN